MYDNGVALGGAAMAEPGNFLIDTPSVAALYLDRQPEHHCIMWRGPKIIQF
jgi:hypothetical protein